MKGSEPGTQPRSLREAVYAIDNDKDFNNYVSSFGNKLPPRAAEIRYEKNAVSCLKTLLYIITDH
jgi:hypothetical protein